jgi:hypothetical protein
MAHSTARGMSQDRCSTACGLVVLDSSSVIRAIRAWFWLAAQTGDVEEKRRCLNAVLELDPENEPASLALLLFDQRRPTS